MIIEGIQGVSTIAQSAKNADISTGPSDDGGGFAQMLGKIAAGAADAIKAGEATAVAGLMGTAPPLAVVNAVIGAQHTLQAGIAIRDKAVSAYQEISRMAI